jgi:hypothetical protein
MLGGYGSVDITLPDRCLVLRWILNIQETGLAIQLFWAASPGDVGVFLKKVGNLSDVGVVNTLEVYETLLKLWVLNRFLNKFNESVLRFRGFMPEQISFEVFMLTGLELHSWLQNETVPQIKILTSAPNSQPVTNYTGPKVIRLIIDIVRYLLFIFIRLSCLLNTHGFVYIICGVLEIIHS